MSGLKNLEGYISVADFVSHLKQHNMVLVDVNDYKRFLEQQGKQDVMRYLNAHKKLAFGKVLKLNLFSVKSKKGLEGLIDRGEIPPDYVVKDVKNRRYILTSYLKTLL